MRNDFYDVDLLLFAVCASVGIPYSKAKKDIENLYSRRAKISNNLLAVLLFGSLRKARQKMNYCNSKRNVFIANSLKLFLKQRRVI